jgi:hypothetical protein
MRRAFTLVELVFVAFIIAGLMVVVFRIYKTNADYDTARQVDEFVKSVDKGLFMVNAVLQNSSFRKKGLSGSEGNNGGLYLMVSDVSFGAVYMSLMNGDCMVRCFDADDGNNGMCGGNASDFSGMCGENMLCLDGVLEKKYLNTYMIPKVLQERVSFDWQALNNSYEVVVNSKTGQVVVVGQLVKLAAMRLNLSESPNVASILKSMDSRYQGANVLVYPLNNSAGHLVIVRGGYTCQ